MWDVYQCNDAESENDGKYFLISVVGYPVPNETGDDILYFDTIGEAIVHMDTLAGSLAELVASIGERG